MRQDNLDLQASTVRGGGMPSSCSGDTQRFFMGVHWSGQTSRIRSGRVGPTVDTLTRPVRAWKTTRPDPTRSDPTREIQHFLTRPARGFMTP